MAAHRIVAAGAQSGFHEGAGYAEPRVLKQRVANSKLFVLEGQQIDAANHDVATNPRRINRLFSQHRADGFKVFRLDQRDLPVTAGLAIVVAGETMAGHSIDLLDGLRRLPPGRPYAYPLHGPGLRHRVHEFAKCRHELAPDTTLSASVRANTGIVKICSRGSAIVLAQAWRGAQVLESPASPMRPARVAELVDAADLKSAVRKDVRVRVPPRAPGRVMLLRQSDVADSALGSCILRGLEDGLELMGHILSKPLVQYDRTQARTRKDSIEGAMLKRKILAIVATLPAIAATVNVAADEAFEEALRKCAAIEVESARLTCFDAVSSVAIPASTGSTPEAPAALQETTSASTSSAPAAAAATAATAEVKESAGSASGATEMRDEPQPLTDDVGKERVDPNQKGKPEYATRIVKCERSSQSGQTFFFFDNDQVWKQANYRRMSLGDCKFDARLTKDAFGYELYIPEKDRTVRVSRIR